MRYIRSEWEDVYRRTWSFTQDTNAEHALYSRHGKTMDEVARSTNRIEKLKTRALNQAENGAQ